MTHFPPPINTHCTPSKCLFSLDRTLSHFKVFNFQKLCDHKVFFVFQLPLSPATLWSTISCSQYAAIRRLHDCTDYPHCLHIVCWLPYSLPIELESCSAVRLDQWKRESRFGTDKTSFLHRKLKRQPYAWRRTLVHAFFARSYCTPLHSRLATVLRAAFHREESFSMANLLNGHRELQKAAG